MDSAYVDDSQVFHFYKIGRFHGYSGRFGDACVHKDSELSNTICANILR